ncbi:hypothetical protein SAMN04490244_10198 [Tranquillimonas rosea]|uniref:Transmembrane protein (PGPGW) n=1 Tax=Tranquillimonas rosea TaxID=641238 RepID=A0A1H9PCJ3_9RHOB|nr:hypothetical protein [Tranquillimonas rosea]SER45293.1 hypothetical protein SAMN04490244_10198 [Tranquillimonas rosea]
MDKNERRLHRQVDALGRAVPAARRPIRTMAGPRRRWLRIPLGVALVLGGIFSILPVLGLWMLPLGLLLLAYDLPMLRPTVVRGAIWIRRKMPARFRRGRTGRLADED